MTATPLPRHNLRVEPGPPPVTGWRKLARYCLGVVLTPAYWLAAHRYRTPGLQFHLRCAQLGVQLLLAPRSPIETGWSYQFLFLPMDSTRYFEFDVAWEWLTAAPAQRHLDVSSPRLLPLLFLKAQPHLQADWINPDRDDLAVTSKLARAAGLAARCRLHPCTLEAVPFEPASFDLITCLSVLEHIPADAAAVEKLWSLLQPGGRLVLTLPCQAQAAEQYLNQNQYGLLSPDAEGFVFWQRFYDAQLLAERILSVTGSPRQQRLYGEKTAGLFQANAHSKRQAYFTSYPFWREPYMMGRDYRYFERLEELPGEGVVALEFVKP